MPPNRAYRINGVGDARAYIYIYIHTHTHTRFEALPTNHSHTATVRTQKRVAIARRNSASQPSARKSASP